MNVEIRVAWGDMDAFGHVNNAVFLRWFETARIDWFDTVDFPDEPGVHGPVVRTASVEYLLPVKHPDTVDVTVHPTRLGESSVTLGYEVRSRAQGAVVAKGETVVVLIDRVANKKLPLPPDARTAIQAQLAP